MPRIVNPLDHLLSWPVLTRELRRGARNPQGRAVRSLVVVLQLILSLAFVIGFSEIGAQEGWVERLGWSLWVTTMVLAMVVVGILVPFDVARAIATERRERTLELVILLGVPPRRILFAVVASRLVEQMLTLGCMVPLLMLSTYFIEVGLEHAVAAVVVFLLAAFATAGVASLLATTARPVGTVVGFCLVWIVGLMFGLPVWYQGVVRAAGHSGSFLPGDEWVNPFSKILLSEVGWSGVVSGGALMVYAGAVAFYFAQWRFGRRVTDERGLTAKPWPGTEAVPFTAGAVMALGWLLLQVNSPAIIEWLQSYGQPWPELVFLVMWLSAHIVVLRWCAYLLDAHVFQFQHVAVRQKRLIRIFGPVLGIELERLASSGLMWALWFVAFSGAIITFMLALEGGRGELLTIVVVGLVVCWVTLSVVLSGTVSGHRAREEMRLLLLSTVSAHRIVRAKALSALLWFGPFLAFCALISLYLLLAGPGPDASLAPSGWVDAARMASIALGMGWLAMLTWILCMLAIGSAFWFGSAGLGRTLAVGASMLVVPTIFALVIAIMAYLPPSAWRFEVLIPMPHPDPVSWLWALGGQLVWLATAAGLTYLVGRSVERGLVR